MRDGSGRVLRRLQCRLPGRCPDLQRVRVLPVLLLQVSVSACVSYLSVISGRGAGSVDPGLVEQEEEEEPLTPGLVMEAEEAAEVEEHLTPGLVMEEEECAGRVRARAALGLMPVARPRPPSAARMGTASAPPTGQRHTTRGQLPQCHLRPGGRECGPGFGGAGAGGGASDPWPSNGGGGGGGNNFGGNNNG